MKNKIYISEKVDNKDKKFGELLEYIPVCIINENDDKIGALFTQHEIDHAIERGARNKEDLPDYESWLSFFGL